MFIGFEANLNFIYCSKEPLKIVYYQGITMKTDEEITEKTSEEEENKRLGIEKRMWVRQMERCVRSNNTNPFNKNKDYLKEIRNPAYALVFYNSKRLMVKKHLM